MIEARVKEIISGQTEGMTGVRRELEDWERRQDEAQKAARVEYSNLAEMVLGEQKAS